MKKTILAAALLLAATTAQSYGFTLGGYQGPVELKVAGYTKSADMTYQYTGSVPASPGETWGVVSLSAVTDGFNNIWSSGNGDYVYGFFYGLYDHNVSVNNSNGVTIEQVGGHFAFYQTSTQIALNTLTPSSRTGLSTFTGITNGSLLLEGDFASGILPSSPATIVQDVTFAQSPASGKGSGYGDVTGGSYYSTFNSNSMNGHDLMFDFTVLFPELNSPWSQRINDPITGAAVPEPSTMMLLGAGLFGLAVYARRRKG